MTDGLSTQECIKAIDCWQSPRTKRLPAMDGFSAFLVRGSRTPRRSRGMDGQLPRIVTSRSSRHAYLCIRRLYQGLALVCALAIGGCAASLKHRSERDVKAEPAAMASADSDVAGIMAKLDSVVTKTTNVDPLTYAIQSGTTLGMLGLGLGALWIMRRVTRWNNRKKV